MNMKSNEIIVKCPTCEDMWHTTAKIGENEVCSFCEDVFTIEKSDVAERSEYRKRIEETENELKSQIDFANEAYDSAGMPLRLAYIDERTHLRIDLGDTWSTFTLYYDGEEVTTNRHATRRLDDVIAEYREAYAHNEEE